MRRKAIVPIGIVILVLAMIAAAGVLLMGQRPKTRSFPADANTSARNFYAPDFAQDPYVLDQQRRTVEAMEVQCRAFREHCAEAEKARSWLNNSQRR